MLCDGGGSLAQGLDLQALKTQVHALPGVIEVKQCSALDKKDDGIAVLKQTRQLTERVVLAGSDDDTFGPRFTETLHKSKFNDALAQGVNIVEQCSLVHQDIAAATDKACRLIAAAVRRLMVAEPIKTNNIKVCRDVVVVGAGVAGMQSATMLAKLGHSVTLINDDEKLGGAAARAPELFRYVCDDPEQSENSVRQTVTNLIDSVTNHQLITVHTNASLGKVAGQLGDFTVELLDADGKKTITAGAVVLACGMGTKQPSPTGNRCVDLPGLMKIVHSGPIPQRIAIIMDLRSQQGRAVCAQALSAGEILATHHGAQVKLFCDSVRVAAGGMEKLYRRARDAGVTVAKSQKKPIITASADKVTVSTTDQIAGVEITEEFDLLVMADAPSVEPNGAAATVEGLRLGPNAALQYDDVWLLPTETNRRGIFAVGQARGNSELREALADGSAAAAAIHQLLSADKIPVLQDAAVVDPEKCVLCLTCLRVCPHGAISIDTKNEAALVSQIACRRCGVCATQCPATAIQLPRYNDQQMTAHIGAPSECIVFACENSAYQAATAAGATALQYDAKIRIIPVPCAGKVDARDVLKALENGAAKVAVIACHPESCRYLTGSSRAERTVTRIQEMLAKVGIDQSRVFFGGITALEPHRFVEHMKQLHQ